MDSASTVGDRIEELGRDKLGLTGAALAEKLGVTYETLRKWKRGLGSPSAPRQKRISEALGEPPAVFMHGAAAVGGEPLTRDEKRLLGAYRGILEDDRAKVLKELEKRAREVEEIAIRVHRERPSQTGASQPRGPTLVRSSTDSMRLRMEDPTKGARAAADKKNKE